MICCLLSALKLILPAGTAAEPSVLAPVTPCTEPIAFWWDAKAFHAGDKAFDWKDLGTVPTNGASFKVRYGVVDRAPVDIDCTIDLARPRFEIGSFGVIGNQAITNRVKVIPTKDGTMRSFFVAQGQTPDFLNLSKGIPAKKGVPYEFEITGPGPSSGNTWYHLYDTDGTEVYFSGGVFHDPKLIFDFQYVWTKPEKLLMYVVTQNWTDGLPGDYTLRVTAKDLTSNTLGDWTKSVKMRKTYGIDEYPFDVSDLKPGFYWMNVEYLDASGNVVHADKARYMKPMEKMPWDGTTLGAEDTVPPPWTKPAFGEDGTFRCWNRVIKFGGKGLVTSIVNGGREQLAAPVAVVLDGKDLAFDVELVRKQVSSAVYRLKAKGADVSVLAECDFDGYVRFRLRYGKGVKSLAWRVPLRRDQVFSFSKGGGGEAIEVLGRKGSLDLAYDENAHPWLWAGDATIGLLYGIVDLRGTHVKDLAKSARATTSDEAFTVTMNLVDTPFEKDERRTCAFYFEPTPVKPKNLDLAAVPPDRIVGWTGHICDFFEIKYPGFEDPHLFRKFTDMVKAGKRVFFYNGTSGTSPESPFWGWYRRDWVRNGDPSYYAHEAPIWKDQEWKRRTGNWTYGCMNSKSYFESKLWGVNWYLHVAPEIKDLYFDLANPNFAGCMSLHHGCRWTDDFGRTILGKTLDTTREFHKRVYRLVKAKNADGALYGHTTDVRAPSDVFFDMLTMGESLAARVRWQDSYYDIYTPEFMQTMFAPRAADTIVRTPPQFLRCRECWDPVGYRNYNPREPKLDRAIRHCIAYIKIHDVLIPRTPHDREGPQFAAVEYPIAQLGVGRRYWCYYTPGDVPVTLSAPGPRQLWAYFANDRESILVILNDTDQPVKQVVTVKGLSARGKEILDGTEFDFTSGSCPLTLGPRGALFLRFADRSRAAP